MQKPGAAAPGLLLILFLPGLFPGLEFVNLLRGKGQLGDDVRIGGIAIEGIRLCGNIEAVFLPEPVKIIFTWRLFMPLGGRWIW